MKEKVATTARELRVKQWRDEQQRQEKSGLSVTTFCRREGVAESTFYRRATRLGNGKRKARGLGTPLVAKERGRFIDAGPMVIAAPGGPVVGARCEAAGVPAAGVEVRLELGGGLVLYVRRT